MRAKNAVAKACFSLLGLRLMPWAEQVRNFRNEGFYERFPAKGQVERVVRIQRELTRSAGIQTRSKGGSIAD
jgi:hypothetical protein